MPPLIDQFVAQNLNGDTADIYILNINMNQCLPRLSQGDYSLQDSSICINAGDPNILDPDSTISDIGAFYYDNPGFSPNFTDTIKYNIIGSSYLSDNNDNSGIGSFSMILFIKIQYLQRLLCQTVVIV